MYKVKKGKYDENSLINLEIKKVFVKQNVFSDVGLMLMETKSWQDRTLLKHIVNLNLDEEFYQWLIVTEFLGNKLKEKSETVLVYWDLFIWNRTAKAQHIFKDKVIAEICIDWKILEKQDHSWEILF